MSISAPKHAIQAAAYLAATTETETFMGRMKDLAIELDEFDMTDAEREGYLAWRSDRHADGENDVSVETYADECVARAEQAAEDAAWRAGCGPRRGAL